MENMCATEARQAFVDAFAKTRSGHCGFDDFLKLQDCFESFAIAAEGEPAAGSDDYCWRYGLLYENSDYCSWCRDYVLQEWGWSSGWTSMREQLMEKLDVYGNDIWCALLTCDAASVLEWLISKGVISEKDVDLNRVDAVSLFSACNHRPDGGSLSEFLKDFIMSHWLKMPQRFFRRFRKCPPLPDDILEPVKSRVQRKFDLYDIKKYSEFEEALEKGVSDAELIHAFSEWNQARSAGNVIRNIYKYGDGAYSGLDPEKADPERMIAMRRDR